MEKIYHSKYWNTNGIGIAIVAVRGGNNDIAAYIGASEAGAERQEEAEGWAKRFGAKLGKEEAFGMLPHLQELMEVDGLHYRP